MLEADPRHTTAQVWLVGLLSTVALGCTMLPLFLVGALGPALVSELGVPRSALGSLISGGFGVAAVLSLVAGPVVADLGSRRTVTATFALTAAALAVFAAAPGYPVVLAALVLAGLSQALVNPATNQLIARSVPAERRAVVVGLKQSGVQLGAIAAGLPLAFVAAHAGWRWAVWVSVAFTGLAALAALALPTDGGAARLPRRVRIARPHGVIAVLAGFSVLLGAAVSATNTYVALYGAQRWSFSSTAAGALVAVLGVAGVVGRIGWSGVAARRSPTDLLAALAGGAALASGLLVLAPTLGSWSVWLAVVGVGTCAVAANAVSMVAVVTGSAPEHVGRDSGLVAAGFFAGFAIGPSLFGSVLGASGGYDWAWALVTVEFLAAASVAALMLPARRSAR